jgi:hypothetical protein
MLVSTVEAVPDGYQKDRRKVTGWKEFQEETCIPDDDIPSVHLPIVHVRITVSLLNGGQKTRFLTRPISLFTVYVSWNALPPLLGLLPSVHQGEGVGSVESTRLDTVQTIKQYGSSTNEH